MGTKRKLEPHTSRYVLFKSEQDGKWYWKLTAGNGFTVSIGGQGFKTRGGARNSIHTSIQCSTEAEAHPIVIEKPEKEKKRVDPGKS